MNRSRKKPLRTYGRKPKLNGGKQKLNGGKHTIKCVITNYNVQNITNYNVLVVNPVPKYKNPPHEKDNLDIYNSSTERKFDLLIGKKPTNVFLSSDSSISSSEQKSGLKGSSLVTSLGSINENMPLESFSERDKRVQIVSPSDIGKNSYEDAQFLSKQVFMQVSRRVKKLRISKRFSLSRFREKIGNSTPIENPIELKNSSVAEWDLSPIKNENDSSNLSFSPDMFKFDSDDEEKSKDDNHSLPKSHLKRNRIFKRPSVKRRSNSEEEEDQTEEKSSIELQNCSVMSGLADLFKNQNLEEISILLSNNTCRTLSLSPSKDGLDHQQVNNDDISNESPLAKCTWSSSSQFEHGVENEEERETETECSFTSTSSPLHKTPSKLSNSIRNESASEVSFLEHKNSGDESAEETENDTYNVSSNLHLLDTSAETFKADENNSQGEYCDEKARNSDENEVSAREKEVEVSDVTEDYSDEEENSSAEKGAVSNEKEEVFYGQDYEDFENIGVGDGDKTNNVLDADNSFSISGFELGNDRTFGFKPGKKYRRSLAALRHNKSSMDNSSHGGYNRYSIIRPSAKLKASTRLTLITTTIEEDPEGTVTLVNVDEDKNSAKQQVLSLCNQTDILKFDSVLSVSESKLMKKIGEGVYGEVFMIKNPVKKESIVVKIIPIEGNFEYNGDVQKKFHEIISEIYISQALSDLKKDSIDQSEFWTDVFCNIIACNCFQGKYPKFLLDLWDKYHKENVSENESPLIFPQDQLYISLKMSHGGGDIQNHIFASARQSYYTVIQVIFALAVAERALEFEHRDLHIGNVLVSKTKEKNVMFKIDGVQFKVPTHNRKATIIDYTLSRMNSENLLFYYDLAKDEELFLGKGDLQFQVYRDMRDDTKNQWQNFEPKTNLRWIHYLATKCIRAEYSNRTTLVHSQFIEKLKELADEVTIFSSCHHYIMNSDNMIKKFHS